MLEAITRAGIGNTQEFERALHRAVLAMAAVQGDKAARKALLAQRPERLLLRVKRVGVYALAAQGRQNTLSRHERNRALGRAAPHEHSDFAKVHV